MVAVGGVSQAGVPLLTENGGMMPTDTKPSHLCFLTQREERNAALHQRYMVYVANFERWNRVTGWARFIARHPLAALVALTKGRELPFVWCRQPMGEVDFQIEILVGRVRRMGRL